MCEWLTPPYGISGITIMPKVFDISAGKYITCVIQYEAEFRPYGPFTFDEVEKEISSLYGDSTDIIQIGSPTQMNRKINPLLDDKIKKEVETVLNASPDQDKKKKGTEKPKEEKKERKLDPKKDKKQIEEEERKKKEEEEKKMKEIEDKMIQRVQEFDREKELKLFGAEINSFEDEVGKSEHSKFVIPLFYKTLSNIETKTMKKTFIEVSTTCVEKYLIFDKSDISFGEVSVNTRKTINLTLNNKSNKHVDIKMKPLIVSNCFQIINSVREIPPNSSFNFIVEFYPLKDLPYFDEFVVYTTDSISSIKIKGIGVQPEIAVNIEDNILFMGNTVIGNSIDKTFEIMNRSNFNVDFEIKILKTGKKNKNGYKPFTFIPYKGELKANSKVPIKVTFFGDHQDFLNFYEFILIDVPNQKRPNYVFVTACCWYRQVYWREYALPSYPNDEFLIKNIEQEYFIDPLKIKPNYMNDKIVLEFVKYSDNLDKTQLERTTKRRIIIGNCKMNDSKNEKNGSYEVILPVIYNIYCLER